MGAGAVPGSLPGTHLGERSGAPSLGISTVLCGRGPVAVACQYLLLSLACGRGQAAPSSQEGGTGCGRLKWAGITWAVAPGACQGPGPALRPREGRAAGPGTPTGPSYLHGYAGSVFLFLWR